MDSRKTIMRGTHLVVSLAGGEHERGAACFVVMLDVTGVLEQQLHNIVVSWG